MQADSVGAKTEIDNLKIQLRKLQEKLSEVISRVSSLEGDLVPSHVDGLTEDQCHDHVNTSDALKSSGKSFELSVSSSTAQRNLNGDRHLVGTAYCSRLVTLPREYEHQNLLHDLSLRPENGCLVVEKSEPSTLTNDRSELVRHFLIETTAKGVKLKGCNNEPVFGSLAALVYQHSMTPLALPCKLLLPEYDPALSVEQITTAQQLLDQGAACNVTYLFSNETESLTGPEAVRRTVDVTLTTAAAKKLDPIVVHLKVSSQGITITDNARKKFFRRHYPVPTITHCSVDPENRQWSVAGAVPATIFGFVARKSVAKSENVCHIFAELEPEQPASAIVNFISRVILSPRQIIASD